MTAGLDAVPESAEFGSKNQKIDGGIDLVCNRIVEISRLIVVVKTVFAITLNSVFVSKNQYMLFAKCLVLPMKKAAENPPLYFVIQTLSSHFRS